MMWDYGNDRWGMHDGGAGWFMVLLMLLLVAAVVVVVVALLRGTTRTDAGHYSATPRAADPRGILQERLARGEIDEEDFRSRMRALDEAGSPGS